MRKHTVKSLNKKIANFNQKIADAEAAIKELRTLLIEVCKHPTNSLVEAPHSETQPPFVVCKDCGYAEEGWGCGYYKLKHNNCCAQREIAWSYVKDFWSQNKLFGFYR